MSEIINIQKKCESCVAMNTGVMIMVSMVMTCFVSQAMQDAKQAQEAEKACEEMRHMYKTLSDNRRVESYIMFGLSSCNELRLIQQEIAEKASDLRSVEKEIVRFAQAIKKEARTNH